MRSRLVLIFVFFALWPAEGQFAINDSISAAPDLNTWQLLKQDATYVIKGVGYEFSRPLYWEDQDYAKMFGLFSGTIILSFADLHTRNFFVDIKDDFPTAIRDFGWYFGSPQNYFILNAGLYSFGLITKNEKIRKTSVLIISSAITTGIIQSILKNAVGRARPYNDLGHLEFKSFINDPDYSSFPSGHTVLSVTMAHAIAKQFNNVWVKLGIYSIGAIAPISRLVDDAHWLSDVAFSAALSILVVDSVDRFLFKAKEQTEGHHKKLVSWNFMFSGNQIGVVGTF